jgi:predicted PurR-regulated permease PerM
MTGQYDEAIRFRKTTVLLLTVAVSIVFLMVIRGYLMALMLAAIFAALSQPLFRLLLRWCRNRKTLAAIATLVVLILLVVLPLTGLLGVVAVQAVELSGKIKPWVQDVWKNPDHVTSLLPDWVPYRDDIEISGDEIAGRLEAFSAGIGKLLMKGLSAATQGTATFFLQAFVMLYAMFFFLKDGSSIRDKILKYLPLAEETKQRLIEKGVSVTRATIKGTIVIGLVQGCLGGIAFAVLGIQGAAFWGTVMAVLSVIPGIGAVLVWLPAAIYLLATGDIWQGVVLLIWGAVVISSIDNVLRPRLVGGDTQMPDLLILVSTLGGLALFGALGLVVGPVIAALFLTMWDVFGVTFRDAFSITETAAGET